MLQGWPYSADLDPELLSSVLMGEPIDLRETALACWSIQTVLFTDRVLEGRLHG
jgi:hypothetical protein